MPTDNEDLPIDSEVPVIDLSAAPGEHLAWDRSKFVIYLWAAVEILFVTNPWQISSSLRIRVLRLFGAKIGEGVVFRPRTRVKFPWKLHIGDRSWIGEGVWIHNQDEVCIGSDAVISQEAFVTTGSHAVRTDMGLITRPVIVGNGAWITARCIVLGGSVIGNSAVVTPNSVVAAGFHIPDGAIYGATHSVVQRDRFESGKLSYPESFK